jgi:hypothetical protein
VSRWGTLDVLSKESDSLKIGDVGRYLGAEDIINVSIYLSNNNL